MSGFSEINKVKFSKLGDCLRYGLVYEIPEMMKNDEPVDAVHLYASLAYMYLKKYISGVTASYIDNILDIEAFIDEQIKRLIRYISKELFEELLTEFQFESFDMLVDEMNEEEIPTWCFCVGRQLVKGYALDSFLYDEEIYYISGEENGTSTLCKIHIYKLEPGIDLDETHNKEILGNGFTSIYGFDENLRRIYLEIYKQDKCYCYYDMIEERFVVCKNHIHAVVDGVPYVVTNDNFFARVSGDSICKMKEFYDYESISVRDDHFIVYPKNGGEKFFRPYKLYFNGKLSFADEKECKEVLWSYMQKNFGSEELVTNIFLSSNHNKTGIPMPEKFSINEIEKVLKNNIPDSKRCSDKSCVLLELIFNELKPYIDVDEEIDELLYSLCDANIQLSKNPAEFPCEELYWKVREYINETRDTEYSLDNIVANNDIEFLRKYLFKETDKVDESSKYSPLIGVFSKDGERIIAETIECTDGLIFGSHIMPMINCEHYLGLVSCDLYTESYYVTSKHMLTQDEKMQIRREFYLFGKKAFFFQQNI